jgi:hypothetical protein
MDLGKFKVGEGEVAVKLDGIDLVVEERYPVLKPLDDLVDLLEKWIPGDQSAQAAIIKSLIEAKFKA